MSKDKGILVFCWGLSVFLLINFVPANKSRQSVVMFLYKQVISLFFGTLVAELGLIKYPVRLFKKAYKSSFSFEYFFYPTLCVLFNLYYPENRSRLLKFFYITIFTGVKTIIEVLIERYTNLIKYVKWTWYVSFITMALANYSSRVFYRWFFKEEFNSSE